MQSNQTVPRKVDRDRITIGSFLAHRFGLRIFARGVFFEKSSENASNDVFLFMFYFFIFGILTKNEAVGVRIMKLGSEGVYLHEKCGTNPSRHLPGPKTPVKN